MNVKIEMQVMMVTIQGVEVFIGIFFTKIRKKSYVARLFLLPIHNPKKVIAALISKIS